MKLIKILPLILILITFLTSLFCFGCSNNSLESQNKELTGSRNYKWDTDTLPISGALINCIWRSSENNVWVSGIGVMGIFQFNGILWSYTPLPFQRGYVSSIYGTSPTDIWIAPENEMWRYDGNGWVKYDLKIAGYEYTHIYDMTGNSADEVYAVGFIARIFNNRKYFKSAIFKFNRNGWTVIDTSIENAQLQKIKKSSNDLFFISGFREIWDEDNNNLIRLESNLFEFDRRYLRELIDYKDLVFSISKIKNNLYFSDGNNNLYKYDLNSKKFKFWKNIESLYNWGDFEGRSENDIILYHSDTSFHTKILHFNGIDTEIIYENEKNYEILQFILFQNSIYLCANSSLNRGVIRGVLNE
jgi:hypothetical protein